MPGETKGRRSSRGRPQPGDAAPSALAGGAERRVTLQVGRWFGADVRPSRTFVWVGDRGLGLERVVSFGREPRLLPAGRLARRHRVGSAEITYLGNPVLTVPLAAYQAACVVLAARRRDGA